MTTKVTASVLANTGVTAGTYGTSSTVPIITIDAQGRIISATAATVSGAGAGVGATSYTVTKFTATAGQTVFTVNYTVGYVQVYLNGVLLDYATDFTASNGTSITLATAAALDDIITVYAYSVSSVANITGGAAGAVLYQSAANTTSNTDVGTSGQLLVSGGSGKPTWIAQTALSIANTQITGLVTSPQIATVANTQITGLITAPQIAPSAIPAGGFSNMRVFTAPGCFTTPPTTTRLKVTVIGGGGGGGAGTQGCTSYGGGGGGGGGTAVRTTTVTAATPYPVAVGAAGTNGVFNAPPVNTATAGGPGGTSSFGSIASATGGTGGGSGPTSGPGAGGAGGTGSVPGATTCAFAISGGRGGNGGTCGGYPSVLGLGGGSMMSINSYGYQCVPLPQVPTIASVTAGVGYGAAGKGNISAPGGTGAAGVVIVEW
jgi:hypothetical protein